jgi:hypothetical protein
VGRNRPTMAQPNIALQLTSGGLVVVRLRARRHPIGPLAKRAPAARLGPWATLPALLQRPQQ